MSTASKVMYKRDSAGFHENINGDNSNNHPSPPASASPKHPESNLISNESAHSQRSSSEIPTSSTGRRRNSSLYSRFEGDQSHRPLDIIKRDVKLANRAPHLRKKHHVGADTIDNLDAIGGGYHHEGPYDATLLAKNISVKSSPIEAVRFTNLEALKATPRELIQDSIQRHRPLDGVAIIPPGMKDRYGRTYNYEEGADLMIEDGGNYKRWPGVVRQFSLEIVSSVIVFTDDEIGLSSRRPERQRRAFIFHRKGIERPQESQPSSSHVR